MKALVFYNVGDIRYEADWPEPGAPGEGEVTVAVSWCGICGTDLEDYERGAVIPIHAPHPISGRKAPLVLGHEFSGRIAAVGSGVHHLFEGQKVAVECVVGCKTCYWCLRRQFALCQNLVSIGQQTDGGMAEYVNVPAENCLLVPESIGADIIALAEPLAVMLRALRKARFQAGETVTVVGAGPIGLCGIAAAKAAGAHRVIAVARGGKRAEIAAQMGADHVMDSRDSDFKERYLDLTSGLKSDVVFDTGGNITAMKLAVDLTKRAGRCVLVSVVNEDLPLPGLDIILNEKEIIGSVAHSHEEEFAWAVQYLIDGRIQAAPMITRKVHVSEALENGFHALMKDRNQVKILVSPTKEGGCL